MRYRRHRSIGYTAETGVAVGGVVGGLAATVATIWGGIELGTAINDQLAINSTIARGALDLVVMGFVAGPAYGLGIYGGMGVGGLVGGAYRASANYVSDIGQRVRTFLKREKKPEVKKLPKPRMRIR